jgi:hypothetical protein
MGFYLFILVLYHEEALTICLAYHIVIPEIAFSKLCTPVQLGLNWHETKNHASLFPNLHH